MARMIDVTKKARTHRLAIARATIRMKPETLKRIAEKKIEKGDVFEVAKVAGVMAAKKTKEIIPLCHPIALTKVSLDFEIAKPDKIHIKATVEAVDRTGVEMEALTAVSVASLCIYDMCKSVDRAMEITDIMLLEKKGGRSGHFKREVS